MNRHSADRIFIVTQTSERGRAIQQMTSVREYDQIQCLTFVTAIDAIQQWTPDLLLVDGEGKPALVRLLLQELPQDRRPASIILTDVFDEEEFVNCYDMGARDYLVKPVNQAYFVSRVMMALDEKRLRHKLEQSNALLREQKILFDEDSVYSRDYFFKLLQQAITAAQPGLVLSLMALEVEIRGENVVPTPEQAALLRKRVIETLQDCCRGTDTIGEFHQEKLAVFMPATPIQGAQIVANRVKQALEQSPLAGMPLVAHVGLADLSTCKTFDTLIRQAATTLHTARQSSLL